MKKLETILCCMAFAIFGIGLALHGNDPPSISHAQSVMAGELYKPAIIDYSSLPQDLQLDLAKEKSVRDTVYITKTDTIKEQVTKVRWRKVPAPYPVVKRDTIREAHYYLATQVGNKEGPKDECISVYEVHEVGEICPGTANSSIKHVNEHDSNAGE